MTRTGVHTCVFFDDADGVDLACSCGVRAVRVLAEDGTEILALLDSGVGSHGDVIAGGVTVGSFGERPTHLAASA
ncbi:hypothetical protein [Pengzhenrongella sicca]|uniref:Uncharacterized protein n=1 Tax=Pengzhenrongella sicca TaxID=2819238 RepID=A0A8A4ZHM4_9MICO|nr:hypothetical protein [Pengzhenrongella sicca]QTE30891.1 hypothetical protein J4E96_08185 [Pengzhenrongella sicca]